MSETPKDHSKRKFLTHYDQHDWQYQITVFLRSPDDIENALELFTKARKHFARKNPDHPILWRIGVKGVRPHEVFRDYAGTAKRINMPYITLITTKEFNHTDAVKQFDRLGILDKLDVRQRQFTDSKPQTYRSAVKNQKPHDLKAVFGDKKINRFGILNAHSNTPAD